jgi:hypothetical protein
LAGRDVAEQFVEAAEDFELPPIAGLVDPLVTGAVTHTCRVDVPFAPV